MLTATLLSSLRQLSTLTTRPLIRRIESAKQLATRMAALPDTYNGEFCQLLPRRYLLYGLIYDEYKD